MYQMSKEQFKALEQSKEEYMEAALRLKEELEGKTRDEANDDDDDDDEDEDVEGDTQGEKSDKELSVSEPKEVSNGEVAAAADSVSNGNGEVAATADSVSNGDPTQDKKDNGVSEPANGEKDPEAATSSDEPINTAAETDGHEIAEKNPEADAPSENPNDSSAVVESVNTTVHPTVSEKDAHLPTEPTEGFPDGWVIR